MINWAEFQSFIPWYLHLEMLNNLERGTFRLNPVIFKWSYWNKQLLDQLFRHFIALNIYSWPEPWFSPVKSIKRRPKSCLAILKLGKEKTDHNHCTQPIQQSGMSWQSTGVLTAFHWQFGQEKQQQLMTNFDDKHCKSDYESY